MQRKINIRLLLILSIVVIIIALLPLLKNNENGLSVDKNKFTLNPQTVITDVMLSSDLISNTLSYINGTWQVNEKYELDPNMRDVFFSVLSQFEIRKTVSVLIQDSIATLSKKKGIQVSILNNEEVLKKYWILGNSATQTSFITDEENNSYRIHIPGYRSYVAGIFEVPEADWRTRRVFSALFTNLNSLKIEYPTEEIEFNYKNSFFEIKDIKADSTQLITALENLLFLQTDQYLQPKEYPTYMGDEFSTKSPIASITAIKLSGAKEVVEIFETEKPSPYYLGITPDQSFCLFNKKRLNKIIVKKTDFQ